jgi:hypothetical protein
MMRWKQPLESERKHFNRRRCRKLPARRSAPDVDGGTNA